MGEWLSGHLLLASGNCFVLKPFLSLAPTNPSAWDRPFESSNQGLGAGEG